jgi:DNA-binding IclR family transcriptional regulator
VKTTKTVEEAPVEEATRMAAGKPVGAVVAAMRVLRHLAESPEPLSSTRIARDLSLNPSTCFNILKTLESEGFVYCDPDTKRHRPGLMLLELAGGAVDKLGFREMLHPQLEQIARDYGVVATLWVRSGYDRVVLVDSAEHGAPSAVKIMMPIGQRVPLLAGALGRCFAGNTNFSKTELRKLFARVRWHQAPGFEEFMEQSAEAAERGYAVDAGHFAPRITAISSPILDRTGQPVMALSAVTFSDALHESDITALGEELAAAAVTAGNMAGIANFAGAAMA